MLAAIMGIAGVVIAQIGADRWENVTRDWRAAGMCIVGVCMICAAAVLMIAAIEGE